MNKNIIFLSMAVVVALCQLIFFRSEKCLSASGEDILLFKEKCSACHGWKKAITKMDGMPAGFRVEVIMEMQQRAKGNISDAEREKITRLLSAKDLKGLGVVIEKMETKINSGIEKKKVEQNKESDRKTELIREIHGALQAALFFFIGLYMVMTGLDRHLTQRKSPLKTPVKFAWKAHVRRGKIYAGGILFGFALGLVIWVVDGFVVGAPYHFAAGVVVAVLYASGAGAGMRLARGKAPQWVRSMHFSCNMLATIIFIFSIISGIAAALKN